MTGEDYREYLSDGVYASFDGYNIWLGLNDGERLIALDPYTMHDLVEYQKRLISTLTAKPDVDK